MTVFLSYPRGEIRLAESLAAHLNDFGVRILAFEDIELIDDNLDYLKECNSVCVLYSRDSRITHSVRLANRMTKRQLSGLVLIDEAWDADQTQLDVFASFVRHRVQFDHVSITRGLKAFIGMLAKTPPLPKGFEVFEALAVDHQPESAPIVQWPPVDMSLSSPSDDFMKLLLARSGASALSGTKLRPASRLVGQHGRRMSKPPDGQIPGGLRAVLEAIEARQMRRTAPPAQTGDPAAGPGAGVDPGGQDGDQVPLHPPPPKTD